MTTTPTPPPNHGHLIEALLVPDDYDPVPASRFTPAPATESPGPDWPPDQWD